MKKLLVISIIIMCVFTTACAIDNRKQTDTKEDTRNIFAMDTTMSLTAYGENANKALDAAVDKINELDHMLTTGDDQSEIGTLNKKGEAVLSEEAIIILKEALSISEKTNGAFEPTIYPLMEKWGFTTKNYYVPNDSEIKELLGYVDYTKVAIAGSKVSFAKEGMKIDLGGIAKGYTSTAIMDIFKEYGITSGVVTLGGNVQVLGTKPDGSLWRVALQDPKDSNAVIGVLETKDVAVITSGGYERYFEQDGTVYHHILNPATGKTANSGLTSVTIVSENGTLADALSTALFVMGTDKAIQFYKEQGKDFEMILYTTDKEIYATQGIYDSFEAVSSVTKITRD